MIKDSGNRTAFESGAVRDIQEGKGRCDLLPLDIVSMWLGDPIFGMIEQYRANRAYDPTPRSTRMVQILDAFADKCRNTNDTCKSRERYRYDLVLEVAKHFEEGAKKYGDRNWEKGIPCDRYIDSAVRHYCKWRAGWDDEPHDRAFIWNILCCEWTRLRYGWNLERLGKDNETAVREFIDKIGSGDFAEKAHKIGDSVIPILAPLLDYKRLMSGSLRSVASSFNNNKRFTRSACLYLYDRYGQPAGRVWILNAHKSANLYAAIGNVWKRSDDVTLKILEAELSKYEWKPGVDFVVESFDKEDSESKTFAKIGEQMSQALNDCVNILDVEEPEKDQEIDENSDIKAALETMKKSLGCRKLRRENFRKCLDTGCSKCEYNTEPFVDSDALQTLIDYVEKTLKVQERHNPCEEVNNRYIRNVTGGVELYDDAGQFVGYVHGFTDSGVTGSKETETIIRSIVESSWGLLTLNPFTLEKIIEDHGYISDLHFILELYKDPSDIKLPEQWCLIKRKTKEDSK